MLSIPYILLYVLIIILFVCLGPLFERAGKEKWKGYVPGLNFFVWLKMLKRPWWWLILLIIPGVNLIMLIILNIETGIAFGKRSTKEQWFFGALPWVAIPQLAFKDNSEFVGPRDWTKKKKSQPREWGEAIVFAVIAATVIRTFFFEAFTIPTASMESSMNVGDYLFVSKMSYGAKSPMTPISVPLVHNRLPGSLKNSYVEWFKMPYFRMPGFGDVERMDAMVFNYPHGDTAIVDDFLMGHDYHSIVRASAFKLAGRNQQDYLTKPDYYLDQARKSIANGVVPYSSPSGKDNVKTGGIVTRPLDKREHYIKRCVGMPGDKFEIIDKVIYIDGKPLENAENTQFSYIVKYKGERQRVKTAEKYGLHSWYQFSIPNARETRNGTQLASVYKVTASDEVMEVIKADPDVSEIIPIMGEKGQGEGFLSVFPNSAQEPYATWNRDNYGPINIPFEGEVVNLTLQNLPEYKRVIEAYEGNTLSVNGGKIFINGEETTTYTIKQNYYWLMGDNRHNSADSRYWGYVPEDHVVGKAVFTWMSKKNAGDHFESGLRWNRMFKTVK
ncbi:MAG: signal peptidase I [Flavobacteriales bacterium]